MQAPLQRGPIVESTMPVSSSSPLPNGLQVHRAPIAGTRATTILVAFDAGARTERPEENGMAHFLEHLVFKGGQKYDDYRKVNETAEHMGAVLNAYTSHDLVAFHITCRAEVAPQALDLLTDANELAELSNRFPSISSNGPAEPAPPLEPRILVEERDSKQSHLRMSY